MGGSVGGIPAGSVEVGVFVSLARIDITFARISAGAPISTNLPSQALVDSPDNLPNNIYGEVLCGYELN
jgi:hypothetical protein